MVNHKSILLGAVVALATVTLSAAGLLAAVPVTVAIEGRLLAKGGAPVVDGNYQLTFLLYADKVAKAATWTETAKVVPVKAGRFHHALGSVVALTVIDLDAGKASWMAVAVGGDPEMPRSPLSAVAYARRAEIADGLACSGCVDAKMLAKGAVGADALAKGAVGAEALAKGAVGPDALAVGAVGAAALAKGAVGAEALAKGAVKGDAVSFNWAAADKPGGVALAAKKADNAGQAAVASQALDLKCTGCVSVAEMKFDADVDLGGNGLKAKKIVTTDLVAQTVVAGSISGDGSKLTGIKMPAGKCQAGECVSGIDAAGAVKCTPAPAPTVPGGKCAPGEVVVELKADGTVLCAEVAAGLPPDGLSAVSNGLLTTVFDEVFQSTTAPKAIPDNNPGGVLDEIVIGEIGKLKALTVTVDVTSSDISHLTVVLFDPLNNVYKLHEKSGAGGSLEATYPTPTKTVSGDLLSWVGKSPKGTWRLVVADWVAGGATGTLKSWQLNLRVLSSIKVGANAPIVLTCKGKPVERKLNCALVSSGKNAATCPAGHAPTFVWCVNNNQCYGWGSGSGVGTLTASGGFCPSLKCPDYGGSATNLSCCRVVEPSCD